MRDRKARSFVAIMVVIAISALLLRTAIEQIIRFNIAQNEANASAALKLISAALENYAKDYLGAYPQNLSLLTQHNPPYLDRNYFADSPLKGYYFGCSRLEASGYSCSAAPVKCQLGGNKIYTIITGGVSASEGCSKKE